MLPKKEYEAPKLLVIILRDEEVLASCAQGDGGSGFHKCIDQHGFVACS